MQYDFPKMRGGVTGRLEFFRKYIRFGTVTRPLSIYIISGRDVVV